MKDAGLTGRIQGGIHRGVRRCAFAADVLMGNYREATWLVGDGRSGTTWVSTLLNHDRRHREVFEPFHPWAVKEMSHFWPHRYLSRETEDPWLERRAARIFSGRFCHPRCDREQRIQLHRGILVKDIFANLMLDWAAARFPRLNIVLLIRNPFAVALSKQKKRKWRWVCDPATLLLQPDLVSDYLEPYTDVLMKASQEADFIGRQLAIWSVINRIPLEQAAAGNGVRVTFYENVLHDPDGEIGALLGDLGGRPADFALSRAAVESPSRVTRAGRKYRPGLSRLGAWKDELPAAQIDAGYRILEALDMIHLYGSDGLPAGNAAVSRTGD